MQLISTCKVVRPYKLDQSKRFDNLNPRLGDIVRSTSTVIADWFTTEVFERHLISWISGGDVYRNVFLRYARELANHWQLPQELVLDDQIQYIVSHTNSALRGCTFLFVYQIESDTSSDVVDDVVELDRARKNTRKHQGIMEMTGLALADLEIMFGGLGKVLLRVTSMLSRPIDHHCQVSGLLVCVACPDSREVWWAAPPNDCKSNLPSPRVVHAGLRQSGYRGGSLVNRRIYRAWPRPYSHHRAVLAT